MSALLKRKDTVLRLEERSGFVLSVYKIERYDICSVKADLPCKAGCQISTLNQTLHEKEGFS